MNEEVKNLENQELEYLTSYFKGHPEKILEQRQSFKEMARVIIERTNLLAEQYNQRFLSNYFPGNFRKAARSTVLLERVSLLNDPAYKEPTLDENLVKQEQKYLTDFFRMNPDKLAEPVTNFYPIAHEIIKTADATAFIYNVIFGSNHPVQDFVKASRVVTLDEYENDYETD